MFIQLSQSWTRKAEQIYCSAPLPEDPAIPLLTKMLVPVPYKVPKKTAEKEAKKTQGGLRCRGTSGTISEGSDARSASKEDEEEDEDESPAGGKKEEDSLRTLEGRVAQKGKSSSPGGVRSRHRQWPGVGPQGPAPGEIVSI